MAQFRQGGVPVRHLVMVAATMMAIALLAPRPGSAQAGDEPVELRLHFATGDVRSYVVETRSARRFVDEDGFERNDITETDLRETATVESVADDGSAVIATRRELAVRSLGGIRILDLPPQVTELRQRVRAGGSVAEVLQAPSSGSDTAFPSYARPFGPYPTEPLRVGDAFERPHTFGVTRFLEPGRIEQEAVPATSHVVLAELLADGDGRPLARLVETLSFDLVSVPAPGSRRGSIPRVEGVITTLVDVGTGWVVGGESTRTTRGVNTAFGSGSLGIIAGPPDDAEPFVGDEERAESTTKLVPAATERPDGDVSGP